MPAVAIPLAAAAASTAVASSVTLALAGSTILGTIGFGGAIIAGQIVGGVVAMGINAAGSSLLGGKAGGRSAGGGVVSTEASTVGLVGTGRKINVNNPTGNRQIVYGQTRRQGVNLFSKTTSTGTNNIDERLSSRDAYLHIFTAFAGHECTSFEQFYINDVLVDLDSDGWVTNAKYTKNSDDQAEKAADAYAMTTYEAGTATGSGTTATVVVDTLFATVDALVGVGDLMQVQGVSDDAYNGQFEVTEVADAGSSRTNITYETDVTITDAAPSLSGVSLDINPFGYRDSVAYVYTSAGHELESGDKVFVFDSDVDIYNVDKVNVKDKKTDRTFTYRIPDFITPTAVATVGSYERRNGTDAALVNVQLFLGGDTQDISSDAFIEDSLRGQFTSTDNMKGICCAYVRYYDASEFDESPQFTAELKGKAVYDPRDATIKYTNNAALCVLDYLIGTIGDNNTPYGFGLDIAEDINLPSFIKEANRCDESVELLDGSFVKRYTVDGTINTGNQNIDVLSLLCSAMMGNVVDYNGQLHIWSAHYEVPTHHINEDWFADGIQLSINNDKSSLINAVKGVINNEAELFNADDFPKYSDAAAILADGQEFVDDLEMPYTKNVETAQRLGKIHVKNAGERLTIQCTFNARALELVPNDTLFLSFDKYNFVNKVFRVGRMSIDLQTLQVNVTLKADTPEVYEWSASEASNG